MDESKVKWDNIRNSAESLQRGLNYPFQEDIAFLSDLVGGWGKRLNAVIPYNYTGIKDVNQSGTVSQYFLSDLTDSSTVFGYNSTPPVLPLPSTIDKLYWGKLAFGLGPNPQTGAGSHTNATNSKLVMLKSGITAGVYSITAFNVFTFDATLPSLGRMAYYITKAEDNQFFSHLGIRVELAAGSLIGWVYIDFTGYQLSVSNL